MQLQRNLARFSDAGVAIFAISYDPVEAQAGFADEHDIGFTLLADPDHRIIEAAGILNTMIEPDEGIFGIPFPGSYVLGTDGTIDEKLFFANYRSRTSAATVLRDGLDVDFEVDLHPHADIEGDGVRVEATLGADSMVFAEVATLYVDLVVDNGLHVYGQPVPEGFIGLEVTVAGPDRVRIGPANYPATVAFTVAGLDHEFQVFESGRMRTMLSVSNGLAEGESFTLEIGVRYQACTATECYTPRQHSLRLDVPLAPFD